MNVVKALPSLLIDEGEVRRFADALDGGGGRGRARAARDGALRPADGAAARRDLAVPGARDLPMRALVTGAAGFIGGHVVAALAGGGAQVRAFDRALRPPGRCPTRWSSCRGDVLDPDAVRRAVEGCDAVFHLAARVQLRARATRR